MATAHPPEDDDAPVWPVPGPWPDLPPGTALTVVKLAPDGSEVTRYPGTVTAAGGRDGVAIAPWVCVAARWTNRRVDLDGLSFVTGDLLLEYFSPREPFNVFAVYAPDGTLRGWYANVTYPAALDRETSPPTLFWHDLYLDVVALPGGAVTVRDEDELAESGLAVESPRLHRAIIAAKDEILGRIANRGVPFRRDPVSQGVATG